MEHGVFTRERSILIDVCKWNLKWMQSGLLSSIHGCCSTSGLNKEGLQYRTRGAGRGIHFHGDRKSTRLNSSHSQISYAVFCLKKKISEPSVNSSWQGNECQRAPASCKHP